MNDLTAKYYAPDFNIAVSDIRNVYLMESEPIKLILEEKSGSIYYRIPKTSIRYSYGKIKRNLIKKDIIVKDCCPF